MYLVLNKNIYDDKRFIKFLIKRIQNKILAVADVNKLKQWDDYLSTKYNTPINTFNIIKLGTSNLTYIEYTDKFKIGINNNTFVFNLGAKLNDICNEINYGNLNMRAYPIFTEVFDYAKNHVKKYLNWYMLIG